MTKLCGKKHHESFDKIWLDQTKRHQLKFDQFRTNTTYKRIFAIFSITTTL